MLENANSGDIIRLDKNSNGIQIIKEMINNQRNNKNIEKQIKFEDTKFFKSVSIISKEIKDDKIIITMPFKNGYVANDFVKKASVDDWIFITNQIRKYISNLKKKSKVNHIDKEIIYSKIREIRNNIKIELKVCEQNVIDEKVSDILKIIENKKIKYPVSICHGDLTLSNIIYSKEEKVIYVFDFLDTYLSSYLMDVAKLEQDLIHCWSIRKENDFLKLKQKIIGKKILDTFYDEEFKDAYYIINILNNLRILPYCKDENTKNWIFSTLKNIKY